MGEDVAIHVVFCVPARVARAYEKAQSLVPTENVGTKVNAKLETILFQYRYVMEEEPSRVTRVA